MNGGEFWRDSPNIAVVTPNNTFLNCEFENPMRHIACLSLLMTTCLFGCVLNLNAVVGSGNTVTDVRDVPRFDQVLLEGASDVVITIAETQAVSVDVDDNLVDIITTEVVDGRLVISNSQSYSTQTGVIVRITVPELTKVGISGSGDVSVSGLAVKEFDASIAGSGDIAVTGSAEIVTARVAGSGTIDLFGLQAVDATAKIAGSGDVYVCASSSVTAKIAGSGDVEYCGHSGMEPKVSSSIAGSGVISKR